MTAALRRAYVLGALIVVVELGWWIGGVFA
jgi:hypothetical protein